MTSKPLSLTLLLICLLGSCSSSSREKSHEELIGSESVETTNKLKAAGIDAKAIAGISGEEVWSEILEENKGKVLYIDSWATWCSPCIAEFQYSNDLMKTYEHEDIVFIYLCYRSGKEGWEKVILDKELGGQHYFLDDQQAQFFEKLFAITSLPKYTLLDRNSEINKSGSVYRLSNEKTREVINDLLKK